MGEDVARLVEAGDVAGVAVELVEVVELCSREQAETSSPFRFFMPMKHGS